MDSKESNTIGRFIAWLRSLAMPMKKGSEAVSNTTDNLFVDHKGERVIRLNDGDFITQGAMEKALDRFSEERSKQVDLEHEQRWCGIHSNTPVIVKNEHGERVLPYHSVGMKEVPKQVIDKLFKDVFKRKD